MPPQPTWRSMVGYVKESTKGTPVTPPTAFIPVTKFDSTPQLTVLHDEGWRGSAVDTYGSQQGKRWFSHSIEGNVHVDTFGHWLFQLFGETAITGAGPYTHTFTPLNTGTQQNTGGTVYDDNKTQCYQFAAFTPSDITLNYAPDGLLTYSMTALSNWPAEHAAITPTWGTIKPMQGWVATATLNAATVKVTQGSVKFNRSANAVLASGNTQNPEALWIGKLGVELDLTVLYEDKSHHDALAADTQGVFDLTMTRGAGASQEQVRVVCTVVAYNAVERQRGNDWIEAKLTVKPQANTTDVGVSAGFSPCKVTLINARSTVF